MALVRPPSLRSSTNPNYNYWNDDPSIPTIDPDITSPLKADGSNFPAKLYIPDINLAGFNATVAKWTAGTIVQLGFYGNARLGGGSCQFSFSNDQGETFAVIKSVIGGCMLDDSYTFTVPKETPEGNIIFSWSWFPREGRPGMYHNAAYVHITSLSTLTDLSKLGPPMAEFNVFGSQGEDTADRPCSTSDRSEEVGFKNPGLQVEYGGLWSDYPNSGIEPAYTINKKDMCPVSNFAPWEPSARMFTSGLDTGIQGLSAHSDIDAAEGGTEL